MKGLLMAKIKIENKSNVTIHGLKAGNTMLIEVDENGTPINVNWRRRLNDSKIDGAIVIVEAPKKETKNKKMEG